MAWDKKRCAIDGCERFTMSLGRRPGKFERIYDDKGFLLHKLYRTATYYSRYCKFHQKAYNRSPGELSTLGMQTTIQ